MPNPLYRQHVISVADLSADALTQLVKTALRLKQHQNHHQFALFRPQ